MQNPGTLPELLLEEYQCSFGFQVAKINIHLSNLVLEQYFYLGIKLTIDFY